MYHKYYTKLLIEGCIVHINPMSWTQQTPKSNDSGLTTSRLPYMRVKRIKIHDVELSRLVGPLLEGAAKT